MLAATHEHWTCPSCGAVVDRAVPGTRCASGGQLLVPARDLERYPGDPVLGTMVAGKYAVVGVLGSGGFGTVYRGIQEPVGRPVAVKVVHAQHAKDPDLRARFFREARVVCQLSDPTVVTLFDYGDAADVGLYCVFEYVDGGTLADRITEGPQDPIWVAYIMMQVLRALAEAHALGLVHRDIKPGNIMVVRRPDGDDAARLLDFGIAKVLKSEERASTVETRQGVVVGTPEYLSPEQARAAAELDARSDLYSLGVVGYTLLAGKNPFARGSIIDTIMAHCATEPPPLPTELGVPLALEEVIMTALRKAPQDRFQSAVEMSAALRAVFPASTGPAGMTPGPSYASLRAASGRSPKTPTSRVEAPLEPPHTMAEPISTFVAPQARRPWLAVIVVLLILGGVAAALMLRGGDEVETIPIASPVTEAALEPHPAEPREEKVEDSQSGEAPASAPAKDDPGGATPSAVEAPPAKAEPQRRKARARPRRRAPPPPAPKEEAVDGTEPAGPRTIQVPEF